MTIDLEKLTKEVEEVVSYSQKLDSVNMKHHLEIWQHNKEYFYHCFGDKLIYKTNEDITVMMPIEEQNEKIESILNSFSKSLFNYPIAYKFLLDMSPYFFKNVVTNYNPANYGIKNAFKVTPNMKITKALKYFIDDKETLDKIQTKLSMLIQDASITGKLCFSIHPLDYLSISENKCNWRSCHALDGDYRAGNLSYMLDPATIVCYIASDEEVQLDRFPKSILWNNKKWRMLLFFSDRKSEVFAGRQYPFFSKDILEKVKKEFYNVFKELSSWSCGWSNWHDDMLTGHTFREDDEYFHCPPKIFLRNDIVNIQDLMPSNVGDTGLYYNDLLNSSVYTPYYAWAKVNSYTPALVKENEATGRLSQFYLPATRYKDKNEDFFFIGAVKVPCPCCNENTLWSSSDMFCEKCDPENYHTCALCGCTMKESEGYWVSGEDYCVCEDCYNEYIRRCRYCEEDFHEENMYYDEQTDAFYCTNDYAYLMEERGLE